MMMRNFKNSFSGCLFILLSVGLLLTGCRSQTASFYVLSPLSISPVKTCGVIIGVGPVTIPRYLEQPQIVTRISRNQVSLNEFDRWAEPLNTNIMNVLANDLKTQLKTQVVVYPWSASEKTNYEVKVTITQFDTTPNNKSVLSANWDITNMNTKSTRHYEATYITASPYDKLFNNVVIVMNANLNELSRRIAYDIKKMSGSRVCRAYKIN